MQMQSVMQQGNQSLLTMPIDVVKSDFLLFGGENLLEDTRACLDWKQEKCKDDYFFWQSEEERSASASLFPFTNPEVLPSVTLSPSPVLTAPAASSTPEPLLTTFTQETFEETNTAIVQDEPSSDFDLDAFVTDYLSSPQGQQILDETPSDPATLLFPEEILQLVDNYNMSAALSPAVPSTSTPTYVLDINSVLEMKPVDIPASSAMEVTEGTTYSVGEMTPTYSDSPDYSSQDEGSDISGDDDQDPDWCPQGSPGSDDDFAEQKSSSSVRQGRVSKTSSSRPRKYGPRQPRSVQEKKERKKDQNRTAAVRYRERIRQEQESLSSQLEKATSTNIRLQTKVETMRKDIDYFKQLMLTVLQARVPTTATVATC